MAPTNTLNPRGSGGLLYTVLYLCGMVLLFFGERLMVERAGVRLSVDLVGAAALLGGVLGRVIRRSRLSGEARSVELRLLVCYLGGILAVLVYLGQADFMMERLRPHLGEEKSIARFEAALGVLWPCLWVLSILPLLLMEAAYAAMDVRSTVDLRRIKLSAASGLMLGTVLCLVFLVNYIGNDTNRKLDLSYLKTTRASESSRKMVRSLTEPLVVRLFYGGPNEVHQQLASYFEGLKGESKFLKVETIDHYLEPELVEQLGVMGNGNVVLTRRKTNHQIKVGLTLAKARGVLLKLDGEFQAGFRKLAGTQKVAYLTVGHDERSKGWRDKTPQSGIGDLYNSLSRMSYETKELGIAQGLGSEVPADANLVIMVGPRKEPLAAETEVLKRYLLRGGRLLVFLDPEAGVTLAPLLSSFGLKFNPVRLANDRFHVRMTYTHADRHVLFTNQFSGHPTVATLAARANRMATVMLGAGYLESIPVADAKPKVDFTIHAMSETWNDENANFEFDAPQEVRKEYELAAAVTLPAPKSADKKAQPAEPRLVVVADSDLVSDKALRGPGNEQVLIDAVKWLSGEEGTIGEVASEEDVRIIHTREQDRWWFYLTTFAVPGLTLGFGLVYVRRRRKRG